ncbi:hypothetical protein MMC22_007451 [Lobaria immixta]|nr:hypothetical protein [Lobaria immixta]
MTDLQLSDDFFKDNQSSTDEWPQSEWLQSSQSSQLAPISNAPLSIAQSTLLHPPSDIRAVRENVFLLRQPITWTSLQYKEYWPFMGNLWVHNQTRPRNKNGSQISYYYCRLWKEPQTKSEGQGIRNKKMRIVDPCLMKVKLCKHYANTELVTVVLSLHQDYKNPCLEHNHTAEYLDTIKINSGVKVTAAAEVSKGYAPAVVNQNLQGVKWSANKVALEEAGGIHMNLKGVHNAGAF